MKIITRLLLILSVTGLIFTGLGVKSLAFDPFSNACTANKNSDKTSVCQDKTASGANNNPNPIYHIISVTANIIAVLGGIVGVITIMIGGLNYVTSGGNSEAITKGKKRIIGALIGLAIIALAWTLVSFGIKLVE